MPRLASARAYRKIDVSSCAAVVSPSGWRSTTRSPAARRAPTICSTEGWTSVSWGTVEVDDAVFVTLRTFPGRARMIQRPIG